MGGLDGQHGDRERIRSGLRIAGPIVLGAGLLFTAVAVIDFFGSMGTFGSPPTMFWMAFVGLPLLAVGWGLIQAGYVGAASRYIAGEVSPALRETASALGLGDEDPCAACGAGNAPSARFCSSCGQRLSTLCRECGAENAPGSRFCSRCGTALVGG